MIGLNGVFLGIDFPNKQSNQSWLDYFKGKVADPRLPMPPVPGSTLPDGSPIPNPSSGEAATGVIDSILNKQMTDWQASNLAFMNANAPPVDDGTGFSLGYLMPIIVAIGIVGIAAIGGGSARRYGR